MNLFANLETEFETLKKSITDIDENIRKVTGKDPNRVYDETSSKISRDRHRNLNNDTSRKFGGLKRKLNDSFDKDDSELSRRSLSSQVVATSWETKQRNQVLEQQKSDKKVLLRNKRMFGLILGTLEKFKTEETQRNDSKRAEIEKKLDQAAEDEREAHKKERIDLFQKRKEKKIQMRCLEQKLQRVEIHKEWEKSQQYTGNFIETKTKPSIFYMPVKQNSETSKRLQETKDKYRIIFAEKRAKVQKELNEIEESFRKEFKTQEETVEEKSKTTKNEKNTLEETISPAKKKASSSKSNEINKNSSQKKLSETKILPNGIETDKENEDGCFHKNGPEIDKIKIETDKDFEPIYD